jgi:hypothetical protein
MQITLLQRRGETSAKEFAAALDAELSLLKGELSASTNLHGFSKRGFAIVELAGDDSEIVSELISRKLGLARTDLSDIERLGNYDGIVTGETGGDLEIDLGVEKPRPLTFKVKLNTLRAQLCDGRALSIEEIIEHYCLFPSTKVAIRLTNLNLDSGFAEAWLADSQLALFSNWIRIRLDRIQVFDCSGREVGFAIRKANLERDVISVEPLTLTTQSVLCKLGTDAIGLMPKLGSVLRKRKLKPFIPKRIVSQCREW